MPDLTINSLRGGYNDTIPANALAEDECTLAENVEFFNATIAERRGGTSPLDLTNSNLDTEDTIVHVSQWYPINDVTEPEFWGIAATPSTSVTIAKRAATLVWAEVTPVDDFYTNAPDIYEVQTQSLNGKYFFAYRSAQDRLHVWDGTTLRRTGLRQPPTGPSVADEGAGTYASERFFRIRYIEIAAGATVRRSEPSDEQAFTPSGAGAGARITRPALDGEGETHWEVEASTNNADWYQIAVVPVGTTTYDDETDFAVGYAAAGTLSEDIGTYEFIPSAKYLAVDGDRLLIAGHWTIQHLKSYIAWTPVFSDPGIGNDERLPTLIFDNNVNLDNYDGGGITGISSGANGTWYAFKWDHVYKMVRTGDATRAYDVLTLSKVRGAIHGSVVSGMDENGSACTYFLDPMMGPSRIGAGGMQVIKGLRRTWKRINLKATVVCRGVYYPYKQQLHWWLALDGADFPNCKIVLQVSELQSDGNNGVRRGWSTVGIQPPPQESGFPAVPRIAEATAVGVLTEWVTEDGHNVLTTRPFIGQTSPDFIQRCDVGTTDNGFAYKAIIRSRSFYIEGISNQWTAMSGSLLATASATWKLVVKFIRDFGIDANEVTTDLAPQGTEEYVIKDLDNLRVAESRGIQVEFSDPPPLWNEP